MSQDPDATLEDAIAVALRAHRGQSDKGGGSYILHPLRVMMRQDNDVARMVAVLHDVVEDSDETFDGLRQKGFPEQVVAGVEALTRRPEESYEEFVERAGAHPIARVVKLADIEDNLDVRRLEEIDDKAVARLRRYREAWRRLNAKDER